jgi:hypothetical protein
MQQQHAKLAAPLIAVQKENGDTWFEFTGKP